MECLAISLLTHHPRFACLPLLPLLQTERIELLWCLEDKFLESLSWMICCILRDWNVKFDTCELCSEKMWRFCRKQFTDAEFAFLRCKLSFVWTAGKSAILRPFNLQSSSAIICHRICKSSLHQMWWSRTGLTFYSLCVRHNCFMYKIIHSIKLVMTPSRGSIYTRWNGSSVRSPHRNSHCGFRLGRQSS